MSETAKDHRQLMACDREPSFARGGGATQALFDFSAGEVDRVQKEPGALAADARAHEG